MALEISITLLECEIGSEREIYREIFDWVVVEMEVKERDIYRDIWLGCCGSRSEVGFPSLIRKL